MCEYCDINNYNCEIFFDHFSGEYYLRVTTRYWDYYIDDFTDETVCGISYCPYCGRKLVKK